MQNGQKDILVTGRVEDIENVSQQIMRQSDRIVAVIPSYTYSLQYEHIINYVQQDEMILVLWTVGVRYNDAREFIAQRKIKVYRGDSLDEVLTIIQKLNTGEDVSQYSADLNEA
jgi:hypothetical protein